MAQHNTHRAAGRAVTPISSSAALKGVGGAAVLGSVMVGSFAAADAAPAAPATAPQHAMTHSAPTSLPQVSAPATKSVAVTSGVTLGRGSQGNRVEDLQTALNDNGASLSVDGKFGRRTDAAVKSYQRDSGLKVDGRVGPATRASLNADAGVSGSTGTSTSVSVSSTSGSGSSIVASARALYGVDYTWGGSTTSGFDCSGFTKYVYAKHGISLPHSSRAQAAGGDRISQSEARPGDLVIWPGHVGIYAGNNKVIDAGRTPDAVSERSIWGSPYFVTYR